MIKVGTAVWYVNTKPATVQGVITDIIDDTVVVEYNDGDTIMYTKNVIMQKVKKQRMVLAMKDNTPIETILGEY